MTIPSPVRRSAWPRRATLLMLALLVAAPPPARAGKLSWLD